jgi:2-dehydropantoate 2-reductase
VNVLVVGAGVIGTVYGAQLVAAGHLVEVLAHGDRTDQLRSSGLVVRDSLSGLDLVSPVTVAVAASESSYDLVLVAVQYGQLPSVLPALAALTGKPTFLFFGNNPRGRRDLPVDLPGERWLGFPGIGGSLTDGILEYAHIAQQPTALEAGPSPILDELDQALRRRKFATQRVKDMDGWLVYHAVFVASVCAALYRCNTDPGRLASDRRTLMLMCGAVSEGFAALRRQGIGSAPAGLALLHRSPFRPVASRYWAHMLRSPMGELAFAAHARHARDEMRAVGIEAATQVGARDKAPHLYQLLGL